ALSNQVQAANGGTAVASAVVHNTGCGCSKSACLKRYCECFNGGIACSDKCRCKDCKNTVVVGGSGGVVRVGGGGGGVSVGSGGEAVAALLAIAAAASAAATVATSTTSTTPNGVSSGASLPIGQCTAPVFAAASSDQAAAAAAAAAAATTTSRTRKGESVCVAAAGLADGDLQAKVEVGGGTVAAAAACQAPNVVRSPLGMLPGIVIGDDSCSNRGTTRV
ncbi:unnamed protein product, partial [Laminaria digitata]